MSDVEQKEARRICGTCIFWRPVEERVKEIGARKAGECMFNPPAAMPAQTQVGSMGLIALRPPVSFTDYCAQHTLEGESYGNEVMALPIAELIEPVKAIAEHLKQLAETLPMASK